MWIHQGVWMLASSRSCTLKGILDFLHSWMVVSLSLAREDLVQVDVLPHIFIMMYLFQFLAKFMQIIHIIILSMMFYLHRLFNVPILRLLIQLRIIIIVWIIRWLKLLLLLESFALEIFWYYLIVWRRIKVWNIFLLVGLVTRMILGIVIEYLSTFVSILLSRLLLWLNLWLGGLYLVRWLQMNHLTVAHV